MLSVELHDLLAAMPAKCLFPNDCNLRPGPKLDQANQAA